jgi:4-aminobutyrate aminotransferase-like enzyme
VIGAELIGRIAAMRSSKITAVRGLGLLVGIEFRDGESARRFVTATIARGVIINWTLNAEKVVRLAPPLTIATDEIDFALDAMQAALNATED